MENIKSINKSNHIKPVSIVVFTLDEQRYALPYEDVKRIVRLVAISPLPNPHSDILGVINLQGQVIPVMDIRKKLDLKKREFEMQDLLIVLEKSGRLIALVGDSVSFQEYQKNEAIQADNVMRGIETVDKIIRDESGVIHLLNVNKILPGQLPDQTNKKEAEIFSEDKKINKHKEDGKNQENYGEKQEIREIREVRVLEFNILKEKYGIETAYILKVISLQDLTPLPGVSSFILGVINVHGQIIPVIDLKVFFELPLLGITENNKVIVLEVLDNYFGILTDDLLGLRKCDLNDMQSSLPTLSGIRSEYLKGVTNDQMVLLDPEKLAKDKRILINDAI